MAQLRLYLVERRPLADELDRVAVPKCVEMHASTQAGAAGEALHHVPAVAGVEWSPAQGAPPRPFRDPPPEVDSTPLPPPPPERGAVRRWCTNRRLGAIKGPDPGPVGDR